MKIAHTSKKTMSTS